VIDVTNYSDVDLLGISVSDNQNLALRGAALAEIERRRRAYEDARDAKQINAALLTAKATKFAAWAAGFSAFGTIVQTALAVAQLAK
jgi:hypothetical protein